MEQLTARNIVAAVTALGIIIVVGLGFVIRSGDTARLIDFDDQCNDWLAVNQYTVIEGGHTHTTDLVQKLQVARRNLELESAVLKLDKYHLLICDDLAYVTKDQAETSVLFELIGARYERRSLLVTPNQPFGEWNKIFPNQAMILAAVDGLVHHATILEMNVESYRRREAIKRKRGQGRPESHVTIKTST
jgi:hypothetical protein